MELKLSLISSYSRMQEIVFGYLKNSEVLKSFVFRNGQVVDRIQVTSVPAVPTTALLTQNDENT